MGRDILKNIKSARQKLQKSINKYGLNSSETREISNKVDLLIEEYYKTIKIREYPPENKMIKNYEISYQHLKDLTDKTGKFPTIDIWNKYAKEYNCLNHLSMQYISKLDWNYLRTKVLSENRFEKK